MATRFSDLIILLSGGINNRRLYFDDHPKVKGQGRDFVRKLEDLLAHTGETGFFFGILNGKFIREGRFLVGPSIVGRNLIEFAKKLRCGGFLLRRGLAEEEVTAFFRLGAILNRTLDSLQEAKDLFVSEGITNIDPAPHYQEQRAGGKAGAHDQTRFDPGLIRFDFDEAAGGAPPESMQQDLEPLLPIFQTMYDTVSENNMSASRDEEVDIDRTLGVGEELIGVADGQTMDLMNLMRYPDYDSYTIGHSVRVSTLALTLGKEMGWPKHLLTELATAALVHDVGKAKVPEEILYKPGLLTDEERKITETHAANGAVILLSRGDVSPTVIAGAWGHHLRYDGGGYPIVPDWVVCSPVAAILQVSDVFEALTAARPYKPPMSPRRAFEIMFKDRGGFHPVPLSALVRAIGLYPPGSEIQLTNGRRGFVAAKGPSWETPIVRVTTDEKGRGLPADDRYLINLAEVDDVAISEFREVELDPTEEELPAAT